jgi:hypothetical protein
MPAVVIGTFWAVPTIVPPEHGVVAEGRVVNEKRV